MSDEIELEGVPEGFEELPAGLGFTDCLKPCYRYATDTEIRFGLVVLQQHANMLGIAHGGVLMTLADIVCGNCVNMARGVPAGSPTINLSMDYVSAARQGQWIEARVDEVNLKRRFGFCAGGIRNSKGTVARFHGTFYFPDHDGMWKDGRSPEKVASILDRD
ncbi:MAG: PaaI family thioesterase [Halioglobus sp.]|nr:PaaI family thioesterase [Halioglobus sp.]